MANAFSPNVGFQKAPVTKGFMGTMLVTSCALHLPMMSHIRSHFVYSMSDLFIKKQTMGLIASKFAFLDLKDLVCGTLLIYYFRVFEKRLGSRRFTSYLLANFIISSLLEVIVCFVLREYGKVPVDILPSGPFYVLYPLFIFYFCDIPRVARNRFLGIPITGKSLTYLIGCQLFSSSRGALITACCGLVSGIITRLNMFGVRDMIQVPQIVSDFCYKAFGWMLGCSDDESNPTFQIGATLEVQRQQQIEIYEQQMMFDNRREFMQYRGRGDHVNPVVNGNASPVSESQIQALVDMGFDRNNVILALQRTNNDINAATNILLNQI